MYVPFCEGFGVLKADILLLDVLGAYGVGEKADIYCWMLWVRLVMAKWRVSGLRTKRKSVFL